jgi:fructokinase
VLLRGTPSPNRVVRLTREKQVELQNQLRDAPEAPGANVIAVAGEALVDLVLESDGRTTAHLGGGSFNAARTLGRLGLRPLFVGRLSRDQYGQALRAGLKESGVSLGAVVSTDDPTTFARVEIDAAGVASYRFYIDGTSSAGLLPHEALAAIRSMPAALHVGGLGLAVEPQAHSIAAMVDQVGSDTLVLVDPNCRPGAVRDTQPYRERLRKVLARADVVKASEEDLAFLEPDATPMQTARWLLAAGPCLVLLTHGSLGASVLSGDRQAWIAAPAARVVDTIGAGDAFGAAWLGAWIAEQRGRIDLRDMDALVRTAQFAATVAARTCERAGAEPPRAAKVGAEWCFAREALRPAAQEGARCSER